ncbi:hypothetical protein GS682_16915 [Nostoc sp. B(2019)]|nr:hypothetical protein [Nostoc sp. B(2019)]
MNADLTGLSKLPNYFERLEVKNSDGLRPAGGDRTLSKRVRDRFSNFSSCPTPQQGHNYLRF